jgi:hypothetical protein
VTLLTGFLDPDSVTYDYQRKTAKLTIKSSIARAAARVAVLDGTISAPCEQELLGTITYFSDGTLRVGNHDGAVWEAEAGCLLWGAQGTTTTNVKVGSTLTTVGPFTPGGTGTLVIDGEAPPWMIVSNPVWITLPWPSYTERIVTQDPTTIVSTLTNSLGLTWPLTDRAVFNKQAAYASLSPNYRMYGGEKLTDALSGIMQALNGFYSVDPTGNFRARCVIPQVVVSGTIDFNAAYNSPWSFDYAPAFSGVEIDCSYNVDSGSYTEHVSVGGTTTWGDTRELKMKWLGSGIEAQSLAARLYRNDYLPRPTLTLRLAGSAWNTYTPGNTYAVHNLPAHVTSLLTGTQMMLYSRTYSYNDDLTALELVAVPGGNYAVWDGTPADFWEGSGKVWF